MEISERPSRLASTCPLLLSIALSVLGCGGGSVPADKTGPRSAESLDRDAPPPPTTTRTAPDAAPPSYTPLPRDRMGTLRATDFDLLRCSYHVGDRWYALDCEVPVGALSRDARDELHAILSRLARPSADERQPRRAEPALRRFELNVRRQWILDLEIADAGFERPLTVDAHGAMDLPRVTAVAGRLGAELRRHALETLLRSGERPRRAAPWQAFALARLIDATAGNEERSPTSRELYARLAGALLDARPADGDGSRLAALLVPSVDLLADEDASALQRSDRAAARVLPLTRLALRGDREALYEIFRLAMEYGGDPAVFTAAARRLFPADLNPVLVARHPPARDGAEPLLLLATVRRSIDRAAYEPSRGWSLPVE